MTLPSAVVRFLRSDMPSQYMRGWVGPYWGIPQNRQNSSKFRIFQISTKVTHIETTLCGGQNNLKEHPRNNFELLGDISWFCEKSVFDPLRRFFKNSPMDPIRVRGPCMRVWRGFRYCTPTNPYHLPSLGIYLFSPNSAWKKISRNFYHLTPYSHDLSKISKILNFVDAKSIFRGLLRGQFYVWSDTGN